MKHLIRILHHTVGVFAFYIFAACAWVVGNLFIVAWHWEITRWEKLDGVFTDKLPDGTEVYSIIDDGSWGAPKTGLIIHYKYRYYCRWWDAICGRVTEKTFDVELKER